jgi:hypothetical protein
MTSIAHKLGLSRRKSQRSPTTAAPSIPVAPDEIAQRRLNAEVMAAGVAAWRRARGLDTEAKRDPAQLAKARAAGNAARRAFSSAHPFGLTMREHAMAAAVLAMPEHRCTGSAICARTGIPRSSFSNLAMNVRSKLARHGMTLRFDRASLTYSIVLTDQQRRDLEAIR